MSNEIKTVTDPYIRLASLSTVTFVTGCDNRNNVTVAEIPLPETLSVWGESRISPNPSRRSQGTDGYDLSCGLELPLDIALIIAVL